MRIGKRQAQKFASSIRYSKDGLAPVAVVSAQGRELLMLGYADREAIARTLTSGFAWFYSRSRKKLWKKGEESGNSMEILGVGLDCDSDALVYEVKVRGRGIACHLGNESCFALKFGEKNGFAIAELAKVIEERATSGKKESYTAKLLKSKKLSCAKIEEEGAELVEALQKKTKREVIWEACDLIYHAMVAARARGVKLGDVEKELARRHRAKER